jgi:ribosomal protein S18 acetylase RimI-like enzyme
MKITIRKFSKEDKKGAVNLHKFLYPSDTSKKEIKKFLGDMKNCGFVARADNKVVGFVSAGAFSTDIAEIFYIGVNPEYSKLGAGSGLLKAIEKEVSRKFSAILLMSSNIAKKKIKKVTGFYLKNGYKLIAQSKMSDLLFKRLK